MDNIKKGGEYGCWVVVSGPIKAYTKAGEKYGVLFACKCKHCGVIKRRTRSVILKGVDCFCQIGKIQRDRKHPYRDGRWSVSKRGEACRKDREGF